MVRITKTKPNRELDKGGLETLLKMTHRNGKMAMTEGRKERIWNP